MHKVIAMTRTVEIDLPGYKFIQLAGLNRHVHPSELLCEIWKRSDFYSFMCYEWRYGRLSMRFYSEQALNPDPQTIEEIIVQHSLEGLIQSMERCDLSEPARVIAQTVAFDKRLPDAITQVQRAALNKKMRQKLFCRYGRPAERITARAFGDLVTLRQTCGQVRYATDTSTKFRGQLHRTCRVLFGATAVTIHGEPDAIAQGCVVEIKNRMYPGYPESKTLQDRVQTCMYMQTHHVDTAYLVEHFRFGDRTKLVATARDSSGKKLWVERQECVRSAKYGTLRITVMTAEDKRQQWCNMLSGALPFFELLGRLSKDLELQRRV